MTSTQNLIKRFAGCAFVAMAIGAATLAAVPATAMAQTGAPKSDKPDISKMQKKDLVIFRNGRQVEGVILEETETTVKMVVIVGPMRSETTYQKSEILEIKRDEFKPEAAEKTDDKSDEKKDDKKDEKKDIEAVDPNKLVDVNGKPVPAGNVKVYILPISGVLGQDVSQTPMKTVVDEVLRMEPDILIVRFDAETTRGLEQAKTQLQFETAQYDLMDRAQQLDTILGDRINYGGEFKKKPRIVAWVNKAMGGAAFFPFVFKEIYFTADGQMGGLGAIESMFAGRGDEVVRQKQRSLRLGRAKGMAEKGGYDPRIMEAMSMADYVLSYRMVGGKAELLAEMPPSTDWFLLKDDGAVNEERTDSMQDRVRAQGNDFLTLNARTAFDIGISQGTVNTTDELMIKLGEQRNYSILKNSASRVFKEWSKQVHKAENDYGKLLREFRAVTVKPPGGYKERTAYRSQRKNILRQLASVTDRYREALNPERVGDVDNLLSQISIVINQIETEQKLDRPD